MRSALVVKALTDASTGAIVADLEGYKRSRPVRIGNQAASQFQLDVYGELVNTAWHYVNHGADIERYAIDVDTGAILRVYGTPGVDASNLLFALRGFYEPDSPHITATMEAVQHELAEGKHGELVHRYRGEDGISGQQSAFFWVSFWQVSLHVARGERDRAAELMDALVGYANDLGLLSEECHPDTGHLLGNIPQAISHAGLIEAALALSGGQQPGGATV